jgi:dimethylhistidine N-methyltransferase
VNDRRDRVRDEVVAGLTDAPKHLPPKLFYDELGSKLFDAITALPEYYLTSCELAILRERAPEIAEAVGPGVLLVELGSGTSSKVPLLLDALLEVRAYVPVDIDGATLGAASERLRKAYPDLEVHPVAADFTAPWTLPELARGGRTVVFYPGSTLGNFTPDEVDRFLRGLAAWLRAGDDLLVGVDLEKDPAVLLAAYDDPIGLTAAFDKNLLARLDRELGADFDLSRFAHEARWNAAEHRIEMHLRSVGAQEVHVDGQLVRFADGETVHTESSTKWTRERLAGVMQAVGFEEHRWWTDDRGWFGVGLYRLR